MKKPVGILLGLLCAAFLLSPLATPQQRAHHSGSSAFGTALEQAVKRLEGSGRLFLVGTPTPVNAKLPPTLDNRYTCQTYVPAMNTCNLGDPGCVEHTADPVGHTCVAGNYTCQEATCDTYDRQQLTCDPLNAQCPISHTSEPSPYNHTCEGGTCDDAFTCSPTTDPRAATCDAWGPACARNTFDTVVRTCDPRKPECLFNFPDHCTGEKYITCVLIEDTCDPSDPNCPTLDLGQGCPTATGRTTWGQVKALHRRR